MEAKKKFEKTLSDCVNVFNPAYIKLAGRGERFPHDLEIIKKNAPQIIKLAQELKELVTHFDYETLSTFSAGTI